MWHYHHQMSRRSDFPYVTDWLAGLVPKNPSPDDRPLALLVNTETRLRLRLEFKADASQALDALTRVAAHVENLHERSRNTSEPAH